VMFLDHLGRRLAFRNLLGMLVGKCPSNYKGFGLIFRGASQTMPLYFNRIYAFS